VTLGVRVEPDRAVTLEGAVGDGLRRMFDDLVSDPMPKGMVDLCDALEDAFRRGELFVPCDLKKSA
jgi:hypothetical protein